MPEWVGAEVRLVVGALGEREGIAFLAVLMRLLAVESSCTW